MQPVQSDGLQEYAANVVTDDNTQATDNKASGTAVKKE